MHGWSPKSVRESKSRKKPQNPSFSSSLLDEIYRSMDVSDEKPSEFKLREEELSRKRSVSGGGGGGVAGRARASSAVEDEGVARLRRAFLVQKWMDMKVNAKNVTHRTRPLSLPESDRKLVIDNDPFFFGSVSSSSDSSSEYVSDSVGFCESRSHNPSCFGPFRPKPVFVKTDASLKKHQQMENDYCLDNKHTNSTEGPLIKSKARALKIYANLKKVKQPISPGGRLTTFLNSLFKNGHLKKPRELNETKIERTSKSTHGPTCSSASSFTKSCLSKSSPRSREKLNNGIRRTVRFYPVSVIIDEDCRPCGKKIICGEQDLMKIHLTTMMSQNKFIDDEEEDDYNDDDMTSDSSSDLFELDHLSILKECEELPVYETTHFVTNRAIANGLIC